jgi:hypothetical protein
MWPWLGEPKRKQAAATFARARLFRDSRIARLKANAEQRLKNCIHGHETVHAHRASKGSSFRCWECEAKKAKEWRDKHPGYYLKAAKAERARRRAATGGQS